MSKKGSSFNGSDVSRIMKATAKTNSGQVPAGSFAAKAQSIAAKAAAPAPSSKK